MLAVAFESLAADRRRMVAALYFHNKEKDMLVLMRRPHEALMIGNSVKIMVLGFKGGQVRLGIDAPPNVLIDREEVYLRKQDEERRARKAAPISAASLEEVSKTLREAEGRPTDKPLSPFECQEAT
jgi:carbon storage regulator